MGRTRCAGSNLSTKRCSMKRCPTPRNLTRRKTLSGSCFFVLKWMGFVCRSVRSEGQWSLLLNSIAFGSAERCVAVVVLALAPHHCQTRFTRVLFAVISGGHRILPCNTLAIPLTQGCIRGEGTSEAAPEAVRQAVGGGCQSGWGRLLSVINAIEAGTWREGDSGWA